MLGQQHFVLLMVMQLLLGCRELLINVLQNLLVAEREVLHRRVFSLKPIHFAFEMHNLFTRLLELLLELFDHSVVGGNCSLMPLSRLLGSLAHMHQN
jgi:hypothetical protein